MYDLHNHILPGVDDGARDLAEALAMAKKAVADGTTVMAATPHRYWKAKQITAKMVVEGAERLQKSLDENGIALKIVPGLEIPMRPDTALALQDGTLIPIGGKTGEYVLMEPPFDRIPQFALPILESVMELGLTPVIAHPERNSEVQNHLAFLESCASLGMIIQLTAGSIVGKFGERPLECAKLIAARTDWKVIIASDAHDKHDRIASDMGESRRTVAEWLGDEAAANRMVDELPKSLIPAIYLP